MTFKSAGIRLSKNLLLVRLKEKTSSHEIFFLLYLLLFLVLWPHLRSRTSRRLNIKNQATWRHLTAFMRANNTFKKSPNKHVYLCVALAILVSICRIPLYSKQHADEGLIAIMLSLCAVHQVSVQQLWQITRANIRLQDRRRAVCFVLFVQCEWKLKNKCDLSLCPNTLALPHRYTSIHVYSCACVLYCTLLFEVFYLQHCCLWCFYCE